METLLSTYFDSLTWGPVQGDQRLSLLPLFSDAQAPYRYLGLVEALEQASILVEEVDGGSVPEVSIHNKGSEAVLIVDGEELIGAKQNRVLNTTVVVPAKRHLRLPVSCVEQGRWSHSAGGFRSSNNLMSHPMRHAKARHISASLAGGTGRCADQHAVWDQVAAQAARLSVHSGTAAMADTYHAVERELAEFVALCPLQKRQKGFIAYRDGQVVGLEAVSSSRVYQQLHEKLIRSYAIEALRSPGAPGRADEAAAVAFLRRLLEARCVAYPAVGLGTELRLRGAGVDGEVAADGQAVLHISALAASDGPILPFPRSYWVEPGRLLAGCYPGDPHPSEQNRKLAGLRAAGVQCVISLMEANETGHGGAPFLPYHHEFKRLAAEAGGQVRCLRHPIPDISAPAADEMVEVLDTIDLALDAGQTVYVHCWGGRGRTGTVVGCWLARHGRATGAAALQRVQELRAEDPTATQPSPETSAQRRLVVQWREGQ